MKIEKIITVFINEEPIDPNSGDLWIRDWGKDSWTVHRKTTDDWYCDGVNFPGHRIAFLYGIDIPDLERAHLIG